jgi:hypothetical protein
VPVNLFCQAPEEGLASSSIRKFTAQRSQKGRFMKKKSRIEIAREIVACLKREMDRPRMTESVRNDLSVYAASTVLKPAVRSARM